MSRYIKKLSIVLSVLLFIQILLPDGGILRRPVQAAASGPVIISKTPADDSNKVMPNAKLSITFDESVTKVNGSAKIEIYEYHTNAIFGSYTVASDSRVTIDGTGRNVTIKPSKPFDLNTEYYVLIDLEAFANVSNGANFSGIASASDWNFKTVVDVTPPVLLNNDPVNNSTNVPLQSKIKLDFDEKVFAVSGDITLVTNPSQTDYDYRLIPITSSQVTGSGTKVITITPSTAMQPNTTYTITIPNGVLQNAAGNVYPGSSWQFTTVSAPEVTSLLPAHNGVTELLNTNLEISFKDPVFPNAGNIEIRNIVNNVLFRSIPVTSDNVTGGGTTKITINPNQAIYNGDVNKPFVNNTEYYVVIGNRAFRDGSGNYFAGISAGSWKFTVKQDLVKPTLITLYPANHMTDVALNSSFTAEFSKAVVKGADSIWFKPIGSITAQPVKAEFNIDPQNSKLIRITLPTGKVLVEDTNYYIEIGSDAVIDLFGNTFDGILNDDEWTFTTIKKTTPSPDPGNETPSYSDPGSGKPTGVVEDGLKKGDGIIIKTSAASILPDVSSTGRTINRYAISSERILAAFKAAQSLGINEHRVVFEVPLTEAAALVSVPISALQSTAHYGGNMTFVVKYGTMTYELPLKALNYAELLAALDPNGTVMNLVIEIEHGSTSLTNGLTNAISKVNASLLSEPMQFHVYTSYSGVINPINSFVGYVGRTLETTRMLNKKATAVIWYDPEVGALSYVPTTFTTSGGRSIATFKRSGNSTYALVQGSVSYTDIANHWAESTIQALADKFIIEGRGSQIYEPDKPITRGEFATYIAKGLGLSPKRSAAAKYSDINTDTIMAAYIGAATEAGIVMGNTDGTFKLDSPITRQEMAVMLTRASAAAGVAITLPLLTETYINKFSDSGNISSWAKNDLAKAVYTGVIMGKTTSTISPTTNATRAEAAVMIERLLEKVQFLDM